MRAPRLSLPPSRRLAASLLTLALAVPLAPASRAEERLADLEQVPGPLRPAAPLVLPQDRVRPNQPVKPTPPPPPPSRRAAQPQPPRAITAWTATLAPARRGAEVKGRATATVATRELKLTDFLVDDRPGLEVWLVAADPATPAATLAEAKHVSLGRLKKPKGDQTYRFPAELDLSVYRGIVVWSRRARAPEAVGRLAPRAD